MSLSVQIWGSKRVTKKNDIPPPYVWPKLKFFTSLVAGGGNNVSLYFIIAFGQASMNRNDANFFWDEEFKVFFLCVLKGLLLKNLEEKKGIWHTVLCRTDIFYYSKLNASIGRFSFKKLFSSSVQMRITNLVFIKSIKTN